MKSGLCNLFVPHTTAAIIVSENWDPDVTSDMIMQLERIVPRDGGYRHGEGNSQSHILSVMLSTSINIPVHGGKLALGRWQGVMFVEFDGPRERSLIVTVGRVSAMGLDIPDWLGALIAFLFGASVGSFVNVVAYRLPREISIAHAALVLPRVQPADSVMGEYPDSRVSRTARAMPDVRRADSLPLFPRRTRARRRRRLALPAFPSPRCVRALRIVRRALYRRPDRL